MVLDTEATLTAINRLLNSSGAVHYELGDPKTPPDAQPYGKFPASAVMENTTTAEITLGGETHELHVVTVTIYGAFIDANGTVEKRMSDAVNRAMASILGDADLGGNIRNVDVAGELGTPLDTDWGYIDIGGTQFRMCEITLPLYVVGNQTAVI